MEEAILGCMPSSWLPFMILEDFGYSLQEPWSEEGELCLENGVQGAVLWD